MYVNICLIYTLIIISQNFSVFSFATDFRQSKFLQKQASDTLEFDKRIKYHNIDNME